MKKTLSLVLLAAMLFTCVFAFTACGDSGNGGGGKVSAVPYDVGNFTVDVPDGWTAFPEEGNPDTITLSKGGQSAIDLMSAPSIKIDFYSDYRELMSAPLSSFYENVEEFEAKKIGDTYTWEGFKATSGNYPLAMFWTLNDDVDVQIAIWTEMGGKTISVDDADVQAIIASIAANPVEAE